MQQYRKLFLYFALALIAFSLWTNWIKENPNPAKAQSAEAVTTNNTAVPAVPSAVASANNQTAAVAPAPSSQISAGRIVEVNTDVLHVKIDTLGGNLIETSLPKYPAAVKTPNVPVVLLNNNPDTLYVSQSGITGEQGPDTQKGQVQYSVKQNQYTLQDGQNQLNIDLTWRNKEGLLVTKTFIFTRNNYAINVNYHIQNQSKTPWSGNIYSQIQRKPEAVPSFSIFHFSTFTGASLSSPEEPYKKYTYKKLSEENISQNIRGGWLAVQQRYFLSAWIPNRQQTNHYYSNFNSANNLYTVGYIGPTIQVAPGSEFNTTTTFYIGPELEGPLKALAPHLDLTIDFGWLWIFSVAIFWVMQHIYNIVGNWGWSIVLVTVLIKLMFYKLSETSYRSMAKLRLLQPKIAELKQRYGSDHQKLNQATMELYKKEKANPLGGCLPILVQFPVFIALYYVLIESVQLRQAPFILWIRDLSDKDPYFILPILMGISMFVQQRLNPPPADPAQAVVMQFLPVIFTVVFMAFPSGLVLYWLTNNCLSILQQWYILRKFEEQQKHKVKHRKKK